MAVKFSANGCFRDDLEEWIHNPENSLSDEVKQNLDTQIERLRTLAVNYTIDDPGTRVVGPNVNLPIDQEFRESTFDQEASIKVYERIHKQLRGRLVPVRLYRWLGEAMNEVHIDQQQVDPELTIAIQQAKRIKRENGYRFNLRKKRSFVPKHEAEKELARRGRVERIRREREN